MKSIALEISWSWLSKFRLVARYALSHAACPSGKSQVERKAVNLKETTKELAPTLMTSLRHELTSSVWHSYIKDITTLRFAGNDNQNLITLD
jgi:hypothetical protein